MPHRTKWLEIITYKGIKSNYYIKEQNSSKKISWTSLSQPCYCLTFRKIHPYHKDSKCKFNKNIHNKSNTLRSHQISHSVVSDSLRPRESQHARPPCPSPTPGVHQTHVHQVSDAIQPSHPLSSPSPLAPNPSQHQSLFQWVNSLHEVAKVLESQL